MGKFLLMPKLGMTMEVGKIMKWLCKEGDKIEKNDPFVEVQTDKVNLEVESLYDGVMLKLYYNEGDEVPVTLPIAYIGEAGEAAPEVNNTSSGEAAAAKEPVEVKKEEVPVKKEEEVKASGEEYDLAVIGGGPGGYVSAIRAAQLGAKIVLVEKDKIGGTCLNRGCIPTKAFVKNAEVWRNVKESDKMGISIKGASFDWNKVSARKNAVVAQLVGGVEGLLKKNGVKVVTGSGVIEEGNTVNVTSAGGKVTKIKSRYIIIASGTVPAKVNIDAEPGVEILSTDDVLDFTSLPKSMAIIGGGYIGSEIASVFNTFGVDISIIEILPSILAAADEDVVEVVKNEFINSGIKLYTGLGVNKIRKSSSGYQIVLSDNTSVEVEKILMAVGRKPEDSAYKNLGLKLSQRGYIEVDGRMETSVKGIYAIGDITGRIQLAHVASTQGIVAVENIFGKESHMEYDVVPSCIFTHPEVAYVGMTEKQVKDKNIPYKVFKFPFYASGKALAIGDTKGFVKIIADSRWDEILGVHVVGPEASNLIEEAAVAMKMEATVEELAHTIHPHPTLSETIMEASEGIMGKAVHI